MQTKIYIFWGVGGTGWKFSEFANRNDAAAWMSQQSAKDESTKYRVILGRELAPQQTTVMATVKQTQWEL